MRCRSRRQADAAHVLTVLAQFAITLEMLLEFAIGLNAAQFREDPERGLIESHWAGPKTKKPAMDRKCPELDKVTRCRGEGPDTTQVGSLKMKMRRRRQRTQRPGR